MAHMIEGHEAFVYYTCDMKRSVQFYCNIVGLQLVVEDDYWSVFILPDGAKFALHFSEQSCELRALMVFRVNNVKDSLEYFTSQGVTILQPYCNQPWGEEVDLEDPTGNRFRIARLL